jgi:hypothetical protein
MKRNVACAALLAASFGCSAVVAAKSDCEPQLYGQATLHVTPDGDVFIPISVGGKEVYFELTIGSGLPLIAESAVKLLGLEPKRMNGTGTFRGMTHFVPLKDMKVGEFKLADRAAPVLPQPGVEVPRLLEGKPVVGRMGSTLVRYVDAELYLAERQIKFFKPFRCFSKSPAYWGGEVAALPMRFDSAGTLIFTMELDGKRIDASMLAGDRVSTIDVNATRKYFGFDETSPGISVEQAEDGRPSNIFHAMSLTGKGLQISDSKVLLRPGSTSCKLTGMTPGHGTIGYDSCINIVPFKLGTDLLSRMRIYFSKERQTVYITTVGSSRAAETGTIFVTPAR